MISGRWYITILLATLYIVSYVDRLILTLMVDPIKLEFGLTDTHMGLLMGPAFAVLYAVLGLPAAWFVDRKNRKMCLVLGVAIWSMSTIVAGFATTFSMLLAMRMALACGEAVLSPVAMSMIGDLFEKGERSAPSAVFASSGGTGIMLAYSLGGMIVSISNSRWPELLGLEAIPAWRLSLVLVGMPGLVLALLVLFTTREPPRTHQTSAPAGGALLQDAERFGIFASLKESLHFFGALLAGTSILNIMLYGALAWYPTHLIRTQGVSAADAGYIFSAALLGNVVLLLSMPIFAERIARTGRKDLLLFIPLIQIPAGLILFILALLQTSLLPAAICMALGYSLLGSVTGVALVAVPLTAPPAYRGRLAAMIAFVNIIIGLGAGTFSVGFLSDTVFRGPGSLGTSLLIITCAAGPTAWLFFLLAWKPYRTAMHRPVIKLKSVPQAG